MIIFLRIEAIKEKGERKAGRYSLRLEAKEDEINQKRLRGVQGPHGMGDLLEMVLGLKMFLKTPPAPVTCT